MLIAKFLWKACFDTNHYGYKYHAPVIAPDHSIAPNTSQCCFSYSSGTCCGGGPCSAYAGIRRVYGAGGTATHVMGGGNSNCGDSGRSVWSSHLVELVDKINNYEGKKYGRYYKRIHN